MLRTLNRLTVVLMTIALGVTATCAVMAATTNGDGGSFSHWLTTPGGQRITQGALDGEPGMLTAFQKVYEAKCQVDEKTPCIDMCLTSYVDCADYAILYTEGSCQCGGGA